MTQTNKQYGAQEVVERILQQVRMIVGTFTCTCTCTVLLVPYMCMYMYVSDWKFDVVLPHVLTVTGGGRGVFEMKKQPVIVVDCFLFCSFSPQSQALRRPLLP